MSREESRSTQTSDWVYEGLPNVDVSIAGGLSVKPGDNFEGSTYDKFWNWRIDEDADEFVIRFRRKATAASLGHVNVNVKIEGGLSTKPDGSVVFDGGLGDGKGNKACKFSLAFEISHESSSDSESEEEWEQPTEHEIKFFHHPKHKLVLAPENSFNYAGIDDSGYATCDACLEPIIRGNARWVYMCPNKPGCDYCVHSKCAQMARTIRHPSHRKHSLKLKQEPGNCPKICDLCEGEISCGLYYNCAKCDFDLHPECPDPEEDRGDWSDDAEEEGGDGADDAEEVHGDEADNAREKAVTRMTPMEMHVQLMEQQMLLHMNQQLAASIANLAPSW